MLDEEGACPKADDVSAGVRGRSVVDAYPIVLATKHNEEVMNDRWKSALKSRDVAVSMIS